MADDVELTLVTDVGAQGDDSSRASWDLHTAAAGELSHRQVNPVLAASCFVRYPLSRCCARADNQGMDVPRGSADFEESDELQRLRRRAYGPNADIAGDAAAQARLSELEAAQRRERAPVVDAAAALRAPVSERVPVPEPLEGSRPASTSVPQPVTGASAEHEPDGGSVTGQDPAGVPIADSGPIDGALSAPWWRRRRLLPWVIAAVAVLAAAIGIGVGVVDEQPARTPRRRSAPREDGRPVAQLTPQGQPESASIPVDDEVPVRNGLTVADFVSYGSYGPLRIWSTTKLENERCIAVVRGITSRCSSARRLLSTPSPITTSMPTSSHPRRPVS